MNSNSGAISFDAYINDRDWTTTITRMENQLRGLTTHAKSEAGKLDSTFASLGRLAAGAFVFNGLSELPAQLFKVRGEMQQLEIAYASMLKSKAKGEALLADVVKEASINPLTLSETAQGAKQLLAYGTAAQDIIPTLHMLTDISSGTGDSLTHLVYVYGTLRTQQRAYMRDVQQLATVGVPIYDGLAKVLGVNVDKINEFVEKGKVGFKEVDAALKSLTTTGGIFAGLSDAQSKSLIGLKNQLASAYEQMLNDIGQKNEGFIADVITTTTGVVQNYQQVLDVITILTATYGGFKAATVLASVAQLAQLPITEAQAIAQATAANATSALSISQTRAAASTALLSRAQAVLNGVMAINPIVLVGTALAALTTAYFVLREEVTELQTAQQLLSKSAGDSTAKFATQKAEVASLVSVLKNQNVAESERLKAYNKLNDISPKILQGLDFQRAKTADLTASLNEYLVALKNKIRLEANQGAYKEAFEQELDRAKKAKDAQQELNDLVKEAGKQQNKPRSAGPDGSTNTASTALALKIQQAKANLAKAVQAESDAKKTVADVEKTLSDGLTTGSKQSLESAIAQDETRLGLLDKLSLAYKQTEDSLKKHKEELAKLNNEKPKGKTFSEQLAEAETVGSLQAIKALANTDDKLEELQKKVKERLGSAVRGSQEKLQLTRLSADISYALGKRTKEQREAEKVGPYDSISYWENVIKKAEEAISKTPATNTGAINKQKQIVVTAQQELEQARKQTAIRSFEEEVEYKKTQYALYTKWVEAYGQTSADNQFHDLLQSGKSYLDYLNNQISALETKKKQQVLTDSETKNLSDLLTQRDDITEKVSAIDRFNASLQTAQRESATLADYLVILKQKQDELNTKRPVSRDDFAIRKQLAEEVVNSERELQTRLTQFLSSYANSGQQQLATQKDFAEKRAALDKQYNGKRGTDYKTALAVIDKAEQQALQDFQQRKLEETDEYKRTTKVILEEGRKALKIQISNQQAVVNKAKELYGENSEVYKAAKKTLNGLTESLANDTLTGINQYATIVGRFGESLLELGGDAAKAGGLLVGMASNVNQVTDALAAFEKKDKEKGIQIAIQGTVELINIVTSAAAQRKKADEEYYAAVISQQQQYNLLLNEQIGLRTQNSENVFFKNYAGELKDAADKYDDAQAKYQESLKKLAQGQAKTGEGNTVDWGAVGKGAASGAAIGAIAGPIGAAVGAGIGAIVGIFGGKKKQDEFTSLLQAYPDLIKKGKDGVDRLNESLAQTLISQNLVDDATKQTLQSTIDWQKQMDEAKAAVKSIVADLAAGLGDKLRDSLVGAFKEGTNSALAFKATVEDILESFVTNLLFSKIFTPYFDQLQKDISASLLSGGDVGNDFTKFFQDATPGIEAYNKAMQQFQQQAKANGFDVLKPTSNGGSSSNSLSGGIQGVSESTASVLAGSINAIRITQADSNSIIRQQLLVLTGIEVNTRRIQETNTLLESVDKRLKDLNETSLRGVGGIPR